MLRTQLCELLDIEYPVISAPMGIVAGTELAAAVSNAGGLGIMSFNGNPPSLLRQEIRRLRELTDDRPFGVNLLLTLSGEEHVAVCLEERVPVLSFFWGDPSPYVERAHAAGVRVFDQVGSVEAARRSARAGVAVIVAQGFEAGGADARGLVAALALGAEAAALGTRFLATPEARAHPAYKRKVVAATEEDTVHTLLFGGGWPDAPHRVLRTPFVEEWLGQQELGQQQRPDEPVIGQTRVAGQAMPVTRFASFPPNSDATGDVESMSLLAGESAGLVQEIKPAGEIVREMVDEARRIITRRLSPMTGS
jgi:NAD(P)H-dependent flavin oxidoreductase YrpB (nitropropane dioxygenase family)